MSFLKRLFGKQPSEPKSFLHFDFETKFPHVVWSSSWSQPPDSAERLRYKVFSAREEPGGEFEVVLVAVYEGGAKRMLQHWSVKPELFDAGKPLIDDLQQTFGVTFESVDLRHCVTAEAFESEARRLGWEVS